MLKHSLIRVGLVAAMLAVLPPPVAAQVSGSGEADGKDTLKVNKCGRSRAPAFLSFSVFSDGTWSAIDEQAYTFFGFYTEVSKKKLELTFDPASESLLISILEGTATALCSQSVTVTSAQRKKFFLKRNRRKTKAAVRIRYLLVGTSAGGSGKAKYTLKAKGPYSELLSAGAQVVPMSSTRP